MKKLLFIGVRQIVAAVLFFLCTMGYAIVAGIATGVTSSMGESQLQVDDSTVFCHYLNHVNADTVTCRYAAYIINQSEENYEGHIFLEVSEKEKGEAVRLSNSVSIPAGAEEYCQFEFHVRLSSEVVLTVLDKNGKPISESSSFCLDADVEECTEPSSATFIKTMQVIDENNDSQEYMGDSMRCGIIALNYNFVSGTPGSSFIWPSSRVFDIHLADLYGLHRISIDPEIFFRTIEDAAVTDEHIWNKPILDTFMRGGRYERMCKIRDFGISHSDTVTMYDDPSLRFDFGSFVITGKDIEIRAAYNTGYPYEDDVRGHTYKSNITTTYIKPVTGSEPDTIPDFDRQSHSTLFDLTTYPLLAGVDTFTYAIKQPELGEYVLSFQSEFRDGKRDANFHIQVEDTLRSDFSLSQNSFTKDDDCKAVFHYRLDKRWPYISNHLKDATPSVHIVPSCTHYENRMTLSDSLRVDSLYRLDNHTDSLMAQAITDSLTGIFEYMKDSLVVPVGENMPLDIEGDFEFSVNDCLADDSLNLVILIKNIDADDIKLDYRIYVHSMPTQIETVPSGNSPVADSNRLYNLQGIPVSDEYKGIVIRHGKVRMNNLKYHGQP